MGEKGVVISVAKDKKKKKTINQLPEHVSILPHIKESSFVFLKFKKYS